MNLRLELTDEKVAKDVHLELDEQELTKLIDAMTKIEQVRANVGHAFKRLSRPSLL